MKLLFDQNLSPKLALRLTDIFPDSTHVHSLGLDQHDDSAIWDCAHNNKLTIVTKDTDFLDYSSAFGSPPHVLLIQLGNCTTTQVEEVIRRNEKAIREIVQSTSGLLALY